MDPKKLLQQRANLIAQARAILEKAEKENRDVTTEEKAQWDKLMTDAVGLKERADRLAQQQALDAEMEAPVTPPLAPPSSGDPRAEENEEQKKRHALFIKVLRFGRESLRPEELRALQSDKDTGGGYLVTPQQFVNDLIKTLDDMVFVRKNATVIQVPTADSLGVPSLDNDPADPTWTSELAIGTEDSTMSFGKREFRPHPLGKYIKVSRKLLRQASNVEALVRQRLAYKKAVVEENAYLNGNGAEQPLGIYVASTNGVPTTRDFSTGNTATEIRFDGLIEAKYGLKQGYWPKARWNFHRDAVKMIAKLKDGEGQYIWRESVRVGEPDRLLNFPLDMSEYAPNTFTASQYVGALCDWSNYWIADALDMDFQILNELFAATNQVGIVLRAETDGMPVLAEAFARVQLAA